MTGSMSAGRTSAGGTRGADLVGRNCGCEVMVKHWGKPTSHADSGDLVCHCGQRMEPEHPGRGGQATAPQGEGFDQEDFLDHGGGGFAGEATGMGRTSSRGSSPGGRR